MSRPLIQNGIAELERLFEQSLTNPDTLTLLEAELSFRTVPRATALRQKVKRALGGAKEAPEPKQEPLFAPSLAAQPLASQTTETSVREPSTQSALSIEEACKVLRVAPGSSWDEIEYARRQIVDKARPDRLEQLSADKRSYVRQEAQMANAAHQALFQLRRA